MLESGMTTQLQGFPPEVVDCFDRKLLQKAEPFMVFKRYASLEPVLNDAWTMNLKEKRSNEKMRKEDREQAIENNKKQLYFVADWTYLMNESSCDFEYTTSKEIVAKSLATECQVFKLTDDGRLERVKEITVRQDD